MPTYVVRDSMHQCCEITADTATVEETSRDLVFYVEETEVARFAKGWIAYAEKDTVQAYQIVEMR